MKIFTVIFSIYILSLNIIPCSDSTTIDYDSEIAQVQKSISEQDHNSTIGDTCSPFCNCQCCHSNTIDFGLINFEPFQPKFLENKFSHFSGLGKDVFLSLLQPPRA
ncbi:hypothetical protein H0I23_03710 [Cellulophaga sp. HaHaR_3_176]|uniref:DUF6660 family protein n=1 Tax=Cellulophaga sp. HaHaR_3_176 TaxID=1942464 RepID=UPI001C2005FB|nr:DUF6660 family protein [Cellulophaga sp. HaHaR_3_176]QWX84759.1 hypothetical protein H0I23_03710 [Cellulophaga sp. HaHaR_3_176]